MRPITAIDAELDSLEIPESPLASRARVVDGASFILDAPDRVPAVWGHDDVVGWSVGEPLVIAAPPGVGKTTLMAQLVKGRLGLVDRVLDLPVVPATRRLLYLACDRPEQIRRALHRVFDESHRDVLEERLAAWTGPPPYDFAKRPETLLEMCIQHDADTVFIDSLKDVATKLSDDEVGAALNSAIQLAIAEGVEVVAAHHNRKAGSGNEKPNTLDDIYGSRWITAGVGSVLMLWGEPGDMLVELRHLKTPASEIGPMTLGFDHLTGAVTIHRGQVDTLTVLRGSPHGITAKDLATLMFDKANPTEKEQRKARHRLDLLVKRTPPLAHRVEGTAGGPTGSTPNRYYAITTDTP